MAVAALAGVRSGLSYERVDDLRIVVSEACTSAIESWSGDEARVLLRCLDGPERLEVRIQAPAGAFDTALAQGPPEQHDEFRISLIRALVDEAEIHPSPSGSELRLVLFRESPADDDDLPA